MLYTIEELEEKLSGNVFKVYEVFKDFFGEHFVDLQNRINPDVILCSAGYSDYDRSDEELSVLNESTDGHEWDIIVYWPRVTVTNEHDKSVDIQELYAKVTIQKDGCIPYECRGFALNRTRYSIEQFNHGRGYMHSHICSIPKDNLSEFQLPCLGSGPINETIHSLKNEFNEVTWMLFCQELSMYVTVESLSGVPYNYLENIGASKSDYSYAGYFDINEVQFRTFLNKWNLFSDRETLNDFIKYYITNGHLCFNYQEGRYMVGTSYYDYIIDVSNCFIDYYNNNPILKRHVSVDDLFDEQIINKVKVKNQKFFRPKDEDSTDVSEFIGKYVLTFKGEAKYLQINGANSSNVRPTIVVNNTLAMYILLTSLFIINYKYKNEQTSRNKEITRTGKNVRYL